MKVKVGNEKWEGTLGAASIYHLWQQMASRWWWQLMWTRLSLMGRSNSAPDVFDLWYICDKCQNIDDGTEIQTILCDSKKIHKHSCVQMWNLSVCTLNWTDKITLNIWEAVNRTRLEWHSKFTLTFWFQVFCKRRFYIVRILNGSWIDRYMIHDQSQKVCLMFGPPLLLK